MRVRAERILARLVEAHEFGIVCVKVVFFEIIQAEFPHPRGVGYVSAVGQSEKGILCRCVCSATALLADNLRLLLRTGDQRI